MVEMENNNTSKPRHLHLSSIPQSLLRRRTTSAMWDWKFDPFQAFEVEHEACLHLEITIERGESISKGSTLQDFMDTPDPYVVLKIPGSSNSSKRTSHIDNCTNPMWNESFNFFLDPAKEEYVLYVILMDANYTMDETLGEQMFSLNMLTMDKPEDVIFNFQNGSKVYTKLTLQKNKNPDLRFSLALCQEEKNFLEIRRQRVFESMKKFLGDKAPENEKQVPIIGVLGSGGGFRAMTCLSGAIKALQETGILDCTTYMAGLSGSSWYISTLIAHENFPNITHSQVQKELRDSVTQDWKKQLVNSLGYVTSMVAKYKQGQPVSFTDFFGHLLGDVLLKKNKHKKLTETQPILQKGLIPMPLYTCLHAKKKVSCRSFSEWIEFTPFEIGIAKYGTFMKTADFGCKFIVGKKIKDFEEFPLHFLQGVWGSAFTILVKRLVMEGGKKDIVQIMRDAQKEDNMQNINNMKDTHSSAESSDTEDEKYIEGRDDESSSGYECEEDEEYEEEGCQGLTTTSNCTALNGFSEAIQEEREEDWCGGDGGGVEKSVDRLPLKDSGSVKVQDGVKKMLVSKSFDCLIGSNGSRKSSDVPKSCAENSEIPASKSYECLSKEGAASRKTSDVPKTSKDSNGMPTSKSFECLSEEGTARSKEAKSKMRKQSAFNFNIPRKTTKAESRKFSTESDPGVRTEYQRTTTQQQSRLHRRGAFKASRNKSEPTPAATTTDAAAAATATASSPDTWASRRQTLRRSRVQKKAGLWDGLKQSIMTGTNILNSRAGRAGEVLNPFRGLSLRHSYPISPFAKDVMGADEDQEDAVDSDTVFGASCRYKPLDNKAKKLFIVDSGLAFNSPYPLLLRPQRAVDIYLSFDFSQRPTDNSQPFKELLLAEKWATQNKVPFPPIENQVAQYEGEEVRECYVFKHPTAQDCPVILHFPLVNNRFRHFKAPGIPRETEEEKRFGDFPIFDDPLNPYSCMNFVYEGIQFDRLTKLMEFNTLVSVDTIKQELEAIVQKKQQERESTKNKKMWKRVMGYISSGSSNRLTLRLSQEKEEELRLMSRYKSFEDESEDSDVYVDARQDMTDEESSEF